MKHDTSLLRWHRALAAILLFGTASTDAMAMGAINRNRADADVPIVPQTPDFNPERNAYFGDLHVHTKYSFDAFIFNVRATPDDAYAFAKGEPVQHAAGFTMRLSDRPLDFLAVTDHSEYMGVLPAMADPDSPLSKVPYAADLVSSDPDKIIAAFRRVAESLRDGKYLPELQDLATQKSAWAVQIDAAERNYEPGKFTTFIGYEFTSAPGGRNLHRNVIFSGSKVPELPFTALDSQNPEELWTWLDAQRAKGIEALAIPHNSNGSDGTMFEIETWNDEPIDALYASLRQRNEPLVEITQVKGTSETHPMLSPNDEWAGFEISESYIGSTDLVTHFDGGYVRKALMRGMELNGQLGDNPFKYGFVGASDTHNAAGSFDESNYFSKVGLVDSTAVRRGSVPPKGETWKTYTPTANVARYSYWGASGLTGVWAEENTREAVYAAMRRRETFATSGPRIRVRFFAGYDFPDGIEQSVKMTKLAYKGGVPMGADLKGRSSATPEFLVWAVRDPKSGWLQRAQVVKGWLEIGVAKEKVFDVSCADGLAPDPQNYRCPDNGATVDLSDCSYSAGKGAVELKTRWRDPEFDAGMPAFYYVRVLENPSCRWSTWDALRAGTEPNPKLPATIQERAWSSPIWFVPAGG